MATQVNAVWFKCTGNQVASLRKQVIPDNFV